MRSNNRSIGTLAAALLALLLMALPGASFASQLKGLLLDAIDKGTTSGIVTDQIAAYIHKQTGTTAPVNVEVTTLKIYSQEGCRRLNAKFTMPGVTMKLPSGEQAFEMNMGINLCRDGSPPVEGMDLSEVSKSLSGQNGGIPAKLPKSPPP